MQTLHLCNAHQHPGLRIFMLLPLVDHLSVCNLKACKWNIKRFKTKKCWYVNSSSSGISFLKKNFPLWLGNLWQQTIFTPSLAFCDRYIKMINRTIYLLEQFFRQGNFFSACLACFGGKLHTQLFHFWNKDLMHDSKLRVLTTFAKAIFTREVIYMIRNSIRQLCVFLCSYPVNIPNFIFECVYFSLNDWYKDKW